MLEAIRLYAGDDVQQACASTRRPARRCSARPRHVPADGDHPAVAALPLRRGQGLRPLHDDQLPRVVRDARLAPASCSTTSPPAAGRSSSRARCRRRWRGSRWGCRTRCRSATSTPSVTGVSPATTSTRCGGCFSSRRRDDYVVATGETHSIREFLDFAFARVGIDDWERLRRPGPAVLPSGRGRSARSATPTQGAREARLATDGRLQRAGHDDGRQRSASSSAGSSELFDDPTFSSPAPPGRTAATWSTGSPRRAWRCTAFARPAARHRRAAVKPMAGRDAAPRRSDRRRRPGRRRRPTSRPTRSTTSRDIVRRAIVGRTRSRPRACPGWAPRVSSRLPGG